MDKKTKNTIIISIIALAIVLITVTYAYFSARITGIESASTISLTAGHMGIVYTEGNENVTLTNIYPREEAWVTKTFTLTGYNTTILDMKYNLGLNVITNTFPNDYLTYDLTLVSSTNGTPIATTTDNVINGTGKIKFGTGTFTNADGDTHNYELKIYFKDNGLNQNDAQGAIFNAKIDIEEAFNEPDGWRNAPAGSLIAGIKSNNRVLSNMATIPGVEPSASGPITMTANDFCYGVSDCNVKYYPTLAAAYGPSNESSGSYSTVYSQLQGKWARRSTFFVYVIEATSSSITYSNNERVLTKESNLLLSEEDDYGTSYYYRGEVTNNYVVFASMCWRIVRIDGAGNTKLVLYNRNVNNETNPCDASLDGEKKAYAYIEATEATYSNFNTNSNKNTYIGYMYSNNPDSSDYLTAHANDVDSTILSNLKDWYDGVFTASQKDKLADVIWCNDKRVVTDTTYNVAPNLTPSVGTGVGNDKTYYQPVYRLIPYNSATSTYGDIGATPSLKCGNNVDDNKISKFTANDTIYGNGALNGYKIGLLTADEVAFAGSTSKAQNKTYYLYKNAESGFWTISPYSYTTNNAFICEINNNAQIVGTTAATISSVRPSVALKPTVNFVSGGVGTQSNPFVVLEED